MCNICVEKLSRVATVVFRTPTGAGILLVDERTCPAQIACDVGHKTSYVGPNITGKVGFGDAYLGDTGIAGAFYVGSNSYCITGYQKGTTKPISFDSSRCNSAYGLSATVQPASMRLLACIRI